MNDPYDLERFVQAQQSTYTRARDELVRGRKTTHWMWFVFPQLAGLGHSATSKKYAIASLEEARAYLAHPVLGARLRECTRIVNAIDDKSIRDVFGSPDDLKFRSSMTLFAHAAPDDDVFQTAIDQHFESHHDPLTLARLAPTATDPPAGRRPAG